MLDKPKNRALPSGRYEKRYPDLVSKDSYHLQDDSARASMEQKKGLQAKVKKHSIKY